MGCVPSIKPAWALPDPFYLQELEWMSRRVRDADRLDSLKPNCTVNDVSNDVGFKKGTVDLSCTRFKTRIRPLGGGQVRSLPNWSA